MRGDIDQRTLAALGVIAFTIKATAHEWLGHGGAAVLVGCRLRSVSSAWCDGDCSVLADPDAAMLAVKAGGTVANLALAALFGFLIARRTRSDLGVADLLMWLLFVTNLLSGGGYMMVDPLFGFGDWSAFIEIAGVPGLRWVIVAMGVGLSVLGLIAGRRLLLPWLGDTPEERKRRSRTIGLIPYLAGAAIVPLSALLNPYGPKFAATSALSTFGGCAWLVWIALDPLVEGPCEAKGEAGRSPALWGAAVVAVVFLFAVLGPSIRF